MKRIEVLNGRVVLVDERGVLDLAGLEEEQHINDIIQVLERQGKKTLAKQMREVVHKALAAGFAEALRGYAKAGVQ